MYDITYNLPCNHASWFSWVSIPSYDQDPWHTILHYILNTYLHLYNDSFHPSTNIDYHYNTKRDPDRLVICKSKRAGSWLDYAHVYYVTRSFPLQFYNESLDEIRSIAGIRRRWRNGYETQNFFESSLPFTYHWLEWDSKEEQPIGLVYFE